MTAAGPARPVPELTGDGVLLTPWEPGDAAGVVALADDDASRTWSASLSTVRTLDDARTWMAERQSGPDRVDWAVRDPATRALVGRTGLHGFEATPPSAEIGYGVHPAHRRRGVAAAAVATATRWAFAELGLCRLVLVHDVGNTASCAVAARSGFALEGVERAALGYPDGRVDDLHRHARLADDPPGPADPVPAPLGVPVLDDGALRLRPWTEDDAATYLRGLTDPEAARWNPHPPPQCTQDAVRLLRRLHRRAREGGGLAWAVERAGAVVGSVGLRGINRVDRWVEAGCWVLPEVRGQGVASRALRVASTYAVAPTGLGLHRVQLQHALANTASCRVAEKAGFTLEGTLRGSCLLAEGFVDEHQHAWVEGDA